MFTYRWYRTMHKNSWNESVGILGDTRGSSTNRIFWFEYNLFTCIGVYVWPSAILNAIISLGDTFMHIEHKTLPSPDFNALGLHIEVFHFFLLPFYFYFFYFIYFSFIYISFILLLFLFYSYFITKYFISMRQGRSIIGRDESILSCIVHSCHHVQGDILVELSRLFQQWPSVYAFPPDSSRRGKVVVDIQRLLPPLLCRVG